jgi:hypothetical protein
MVSQEFFCFFFKKLCFAAKNGFFQPETEKPAFLQSKRGVATLSPVKERAFSKLL